MNNIESFKALTAEMAKLYEEKNKNYGDSFNTSLNEDGLLVTKIRLGDKYNRLVSLLKQKKNGTVEESLRDTLIDLANYAIMTIMWMDNQKEHPTLFNVEIGSPGFTGTSSSTLKIDGIKNLK